MEVRIKTEFLDTVIGFNNSALPLGKRDDLHILAEMARHSTNQTLINLFEELPEQKEIDQAKEQIFLDQTADVSKDQEPQTPPIHTPTSRRKKSSTRKQS